MEYILWFDQISKDSIALAGGKGSNLGEMYNLKLPVPLGFAITTKAFDKFLQVNKLEDQIKQIINSTDVDDTNVLLQASAAIKKMIENSEYPVPMKNELVEAYRSLSYNDISVPQTLELIAAGRDFALVAVRSSATAEDLPSISKDEPVIVKIGNEVVYDRMESVYEICEKNNVKEVFVPSLEGSNIQWTKVQELYKHPAKNAKLVKITTKTGRHITVTPNHSLVALNTDDFTLKPISINDVRKDTRIPVVKYLPNIGGKKEMILDVVQILKSRDLIEKNGRIKIRDAKNWAIQNDFPRFVNIDRNFAYLLGVFAAEGSIYESCIDLSCQSKTISDKIKKYLKTLGISPGKDSQNVRIHNKTLAAMLYEFFGQPLNIKGKGKFARTKRVPNIIFNQPYEIIAEFLKGYFDGDGYVGKETIAATSVSENLVGGVVKLLEMLQIKCHIGKHGIEIIVSPSEAENFVQLIGFTEKKNRKKIISLIKRYSKRKHNDVLDIIPKSKKVNYLIEEAIKSKLKRRTMYVFVCPYCNGELIKNGKYWKQRFLCKNCGKTFSNSKNLESRTIETYLNYDKLGRFKLGGVPWNKGNHMKLANYSISSVKKIAEKLHAKELLEIANSNVLWDSIKNVEYVNYSGDVYDFVVPKTQNFCAGVGGIITHNTASFAGQQATFLNVKGIKSYLDAVRKAWASLFEPRAIFYRNKQNFQNASISIIVQKMVNSEKSGVMFTVNPATQEDNIMIEATWGLGESLVSGEIQPDNYIVSKDGRVLSKFIGTKDKMRVRDIATHKTVVLPVISTKQQQQVLTEDELLTLAKYGMKLEQHYGKPQDIEFAIEKRRIYIVQTRAITTLGKQVEEKEVSGEPILKGLGSSPGLATGTVKIVRSMQDLAKVEKGDILVTKMTSPDMVVVMARSVAIVTDEGGVTAHASIVGREMGLPVIVGTINATKVLQDGQKITVDAYKGLVYPGEVEVEKPHEEPTQISEEHIPDMMKELTATSVKVNLVFPKNLENISKISDGVGLLRIEHMITESGVHPAKLIREGRKEDYIKILTDGIRPIAQAFNPKPVWVRNLDARSDEFRNLEGGSEEPDEDNPMLGWHGIRRSLDEPELLKAEFEAIKRLYEEGLTNVHIMLPFVISVDEFNKAKNIAKEVGLPEEAKLGIMVETPAASLTIEDFCKAGVSFISFGSNDLTQMTLGIDRNNARIAGLYSELHPAVRKLMKYVIKVCHSYKVETSICGEGPSNSPELVEYLVTVGIDSISAEMDAIQKVRETVIKTERKLLLEALRKR